MRKIKNLAYLTSEERFRKNECLDLYYSYAEHAVYTSPAPDRYIVGYFRGRWTEEQLTKIIYRAMRLDWFM